MITVVTTFTEQHWHEYAKEFCESFERHWPKSVKLVVYFEGTNLRGPNWVPISRVEGLNAWMNAIASFPLMSGHMDGEYNINFDARMVRKPLIQAHACKEFGGKVIWLDADVVTFAPVTEAFLNELLPDDKLCCYLGRDRNPTLPYTESGFLGFNTLHPLFQKFMTFYINTFSSGYIFTQPGWHDCYGFDAARKLFAMVKPKSPEHFNDLAKDLPKVCHHPFVNSVLGSCMDHRKGQRKNTRSTEQDLIKPRSEEYWNDKQEIPLRKSALTIATDTALQSM